MTDSFVVLTTVSTRKEGLKIAEALIRSRLAACVNIIPSVRSIYRWKGKIERSNEILAVIKSRRKLFTKLSRKIRELHSYSCPEIISIPIAAGNPAYLKWIREST